jgi:phosphopantothenate---cysteine ligase (CTP)
MNKRKVLVTAGNTSVPIDQVRSITNIFKGRTGARIAAYFSEHGCDVTLFTSHPERVKMPDGDIRIMNYAYYDELLEMMEDHVRNENYDVVIHSAAVSDYKADSVYSCLGQAVTTGPGRKNVELCELNNSGKIGSDHADLWMRLVPTEKIIDKIRREWGFKGTLVKFKLQVGVSDDELLAIAERSMKQSQADFIVANTLERMAAKALIISARHGAVRPVSRTELPEALFQEVFP